MTDTLTITEKATAAPLPPERQQKRSVASGDNGLIQILIPWYGEGTPALPPRLPISGSQMFGFWRERDRILLDTPRYEAQWASAISIAIAKSASMSWEVDSEVPMRRKRTQEMLLNAGAGMGIYGWVPFLSVGLRSFLTLGYQVVEIERATAARGGRVLALHNLNALRCRFTGDNKYPVHYMDGEGVVHRLPWHDVMIMVDNITFMTGGYSALESAAERAYPQIVKLAAIETYVYEKVSGRRPQAIYFVGGATSGTINDAIQNARTDADRKNLSVYMGAAVVPVMGDVPVSVESIPLAELPDGFNPEQERNRADLIYANAIGLDPQSLNPQIVGRQGLGSTGNQSQVLENKEKQSGLAAWRQQFMHQINQMALDDKTTFTFKENDIRDRIQEAEVRKVGAETRKTQIESGEITPEQARNLAVDHDELPVEFITEDATAGDTITDTQKPDQQEEDMGEAVEARPKEDEIEEKSANKVDTKFVWEDLIY